MKKAFTLIELLVVVLIIGILSAIALPQYTKTVERSRLAEGELMLRALRDAQARCLLENTNDWSRCTQNDEGSDLFANMDIEVGSEKTASIVMACNTCARKGKNFTYVLDGEYIYAERVRDGNLLYTLETTAYPEETVWYNQIVCGDGSMNCKDVGYTVDTGTGAWKKP